MLVRCDRDHAQGGRAVTALDSRRFAIRMLIMYVFVAAAVVGMYYGLTLQQRSAHHSEVKFEREYVAICQATNTSNAKFNGVLDQLSKNAQNTTGITAEQKIQAIQTYASLHLPISACPR